MHSNGLLHEHIGVVSMHRKDDDYVFCHKVFCCGVFPVEPEVISKHVLAIDPPIKPSPIIIILSKMCISNLVN